MDIIAIVWDREQKVQNNDSKEKITDTTEYCVRLDPGTFAMRSERNTTRPTACTKQRC